MSTYLEPIGVSSKSDYGGRKTKKAYSKNNIRLLERLLLKKKDAEVINKINVHKNIFGQSYVQTKLSNKINRDREQLLIKLQTIK